MPDAGKLSAALDEIRARQEKIRAGQRLPDPDAAVTRMSLVLAARKDTPRLLAAVDAVLAQHECQAGVFPPTCTSCAAWDEAAEEVVEAFWPCPTYLAISRALTGEDGTDDA